MRYLPLYLWKFFLYFCFAATVLVIPFLPPQTQLTNNDFYVVPMTAALIAAVALFWRKEKIKAAADRT